MDIIDNPDAALAAIVPMPKPAIKKVKVANTGNEIKKMTARANASKKDPAAPKPAPQDAPKPTPQSPPKKRKAGRAASPTLATKSPAKKKVKTTAAMEDITAPNLRPPTRPVVKKPAEEDELDMFPKERDVLAPKVKKAVEEEPRHNAAISWRNTIAKATL
jgi:hypothetical protein